MLNKQEKVPFVPTFFMMVGLPASGKSTYAKKLSEETGGVICSSNEIRQELCGDENCQDKNDEVFRTVHKRIRDSLSDGYDTIFDATNLNSRRRIAFLRELKNIPCKKKCIIMATPIGDCCDNNLNRDRQVPGSVMDKMYRNFCTSYWYEGWDDIEIVYPERFTPTMTVSKWVIDFAMYDQENKHHDFTLGIHGIETTNHLYSILDEVDDSLMIASKIHDCGKPYTKSHINSKGMMTREAHYYQHQCVGAYDSLFFDYSDYKVDPLDVSVLIYLHMMPYFWEADEKDGEKT